jgi:hypothetical protein
LDYKPVGTAGQTGCFEYYIYTKNFLTDALPGLTCGADRVQKSSEEKSSELLN